MEYRIGPHNLQLEGDLAIINMEGEVTVEHITAILQLIDGIGGGLGNFYIIGNVRNLKHMPPESRRIAGEWKGIARAGGTAIIGANVITRTLVMLVSRASTLLSKTRKTGEVNFLKTEEEARVWLSACRVRMAALRKTKGPG